MDDRDVIPKGVHLSGKQIDLIVTGGIAGIESPRLVRELRRYGAQVRVVMTKSATNFVSPLVFEWASKNPVVTDLTGSAEHITAADCIVIAPCSLDFFTKISLGLADSAAATLVQSALGRKPVLIAPSMHDSLAQNPIFIQNRKNLQKIPGIFMLDPQMAEGKAKMQPVEEMAERICHFAGAQSALRGRSIALSFGPTRSAIDDVRYISNFSSGALGSAIANEFFRRGADVHAVIGPVQMTLPNTFKSYPVTTNSEMKSRFQEIVKKQKPAAAIFCAAVLDFEVEKKIRGKTSSKNQLKFSLKASPKLIQQISGKGFLRVGFKLESGVEVGELWRRARESFKSNKCDLLVANRLEDLKTGAHEAYLFKNAKSDPVLMIGKEAIARELADAVEAMLDD